MPLSLNLGSGQRRFSPPWLNIDVVSREGQVPDVLADGRSLPLPNESCEVVVLHHVVEHFHLGEADALVREAHRVLRPDGSLLVFVPDLAALARRWLMGGLDDYLYAVNLYGAWQGQPGDDHHWGWSQAGLVAYLSACAPWTFVQRFDWREMAGASIARDWWIASVEAIK